MKNKFSGMCFLLTMAFFMFSLCILPNVSGTSMNPEDQALSFIKNVVPINLSNYNVALTQHLTLTGSSFAGQAGLSENRVIDTVRYTLTSANSAIDIVCQIENSTVTSCNVYVTNGSLATDRVYSNTTDAAKNFLGKYQSYNNVDSNVLASMLDSVDATRNTTITLGNIKLTVANVAFGDEQLVQFKWANTINGAEYSSLQLGFQKNGTFDSFIDNRGVFLIGDTTVSISKDQAIDIALKKVVSYSYAMPDKSSVTNFDVAKDNVTAQLTTTFVGSELRPYWDVRLPLIKTYPGNVVGITVFLWANTGEVISLSNIAFGGVDNSSSPSIETTTSVSPLATANLTSSLTGLAPNNSTTSLGLSYVAAIALTIITLAIVSAIILKKTRR